MVGSRRSIPLTLTDTESTPAAPNPLVAAAANGAVGEPPSAEGRLLDMLDQRQNTELAELERLNASVEQLVAHWHADRPLPRAA
jgi:hypothetical protein